MYSEETYKPRLIDPRIEQFLTVSGAVSIMGPKWCGKTTTGERISVLHKGSSICIADPANNYANRKLAQMGPALVLVGEKPRLIDEWQEVPQIWDAVRFEVDKHTEKGMYLLTGSSVIEGEYLHSGSGRIAPIKMLSMSLYETQDGSGLVSLQQLFDNTQEFDPIPTGTVDPNELIRYCVRGGWPQSIDTDVSLAGILPQTYLENTVHKDINTLAKIKNRRNHLRVEKLLIALAENDSKVVPVTQIQKEVNDQLETSLSRNTLLDYFEILDQLYLIETQEAFVPKVDLTRAILKTPKHRFTDPSLVVAALHLTPEIMLRDFNVFERVFDNLCVHELRVYAESAMDAKLYHYSDSYKLNIDAVVQLQDGRWGAFMNRLTVDSIDDAAKDLLKLKKAFEGTGCEPTFLCVLSGLSNAAYRRPDGVYVVPITALKP